jgi:starvation-inducible DNA-binding protein
VTGRHFVSVHRQLDTIVSDGRDLADLVAERVVAPGAAVDGSTETVAEQTTIVPLPSGFLAADGRVAGRVVSRDGGVVRVWCLVWQPRR